MKTCTVYNVYFSQDLIQSDLEKQSCCVMARTENRRLVNTSVSEALQ